MGIEIPLDRLESALRTKRAEPFHWSVVRRIRRLRSECFVVVIVVFFFFFLILFCFV